MILRIAKKNNLTVQELKEFRKVAQTDSVKKITNELDNLILKGANFEAPIQLAKSKLNTLKSNLAKEAFDTNKLRKILKKAKWGTEEYKKIALKSYTFVSINGVVK